MSQLDLAVLGLVQTEDLEEIIKLALNKPSQLDGHSPSLHLLLPVCLPHMTALAYYLRLGTYPATQGFT